MEKNRDPERARKRAVTDLRCAVRKLGMTETMIHLATLWSHDTITSTWLEQRAATINAQADSALALILAGKVHKLDEAIE